MRCFDISTASMHLHTYVFEVINIYFLHIVTRISHRGHGSLKKNVQNPVFCRKT